MNFIFNGKSTFSRIPLYFQLYAEFKADKEIDKSGIGNKTTNTYKHNQVLIA